MQNNLLVFPSSRAIREYQLSLLNNDQFLPKSITIGDWFSRVITTPNKIKIDDDLRILYLQKAIGELQISSLGFSKNFSKFYTQSEYIFKFFNELNNQYKTIDQLDQFDTYGLYSDHLELLKQIYTRYVELLEQNNYVDNITLPLDYKLNIPYIQEFDQITIFYEGYFSQFELDVISQIAQYTTIIIEFTINKFNQKNIDFFQILDIDLKIDCHYIINLSNKTILSETEQPSKSINHTIYPVKQRIEQIGFIKYSITEMINSGINSSKIVLLLPDEKFDLYLKLFNHDEKYFNFAMGNDIKNSSTFKKAKGIEAFINNDEPQDKARLDFIGLDEHFITNEIVPYWNKPIQKELFFKIIDIITTDETNNDIISNVTAIKLSLENLLFKNIQDSFDTLSLKDGYKIFLNKLQQVILDDTQGGKITVMGILETRHIQYDGVIVIDFNDEKIPKPSIKDKFISTKIKKAISLPTPKDRENLQKYYYEQLFSKAKQVMISYVDDEQNNISRFAKELFINPNIQTLDFANIVHQNSIAHSTEQEYILDIDLSKQIWSASSLKIYLQCKRRYYLQYIQKIKEHTTGLKPAPYEVGSILHDILEKLYKQPTYNYNDLCNEISKYQNNNPYLTVELEIWKHKLKKFYHNEQQRLKNGIKPYKLEQSFELIHNNITITGKIDRINQLDDGTFEILDYKTSSSLHIDGKKNVDKSNDFQLEFYYLATKNLQIGNVGYYDLSNGVIKPEIMLNEKLTILDDIFNTLQTTTVEFEKCQDITNCKFCPYTHLCNRKNDTGF